MWEKYVAFIVFEYTCIACYRRRGWIIEFQLYLRKACPERVDLGTENGPLCEVCIQVPILPDLSAQIADGSLECPLSIAR